eukprot:EG_transcript_11011
MHFNVLSSLTSFTARWKSKPRAVTPGQLRSRRGHAESPARQEPKLVFVREKRFTDSESETSSNSSFSASSSLQNLSVAHSSCAGVASRRQALEAARTNGLFLSPDMLKAVLEFVPIQGYSQSSLVCRNFAALTKWAANRNHKEAQGLLAQGLALMTDSNTPQHSVALFSQAIALYPRLTEASFWKAKGLFIMSQESLAVVCLQDAIKQKPSEVERMKLQACLFYAQNNDAEASKVLQRALRRAPSDASIHFELGFCYHGLQQFSRAVDCYTRALELKYHRTFVLLANRANCLFRVGKTTEALEDLEASLAISQYYELALRTRAFVNINIGNPELAYRDYTTIIEHSTTPKVVSDAYCNRAFCYGDMDEADIEKAREADPTNPEPVRYKASILVNRDNTPEAIAQMTAWINANPTHKDCAFQRAFRAELYASASASHLAVRDYSDAIDALVGCPATLTYGGTTVKDALEAYRHRLCELLREQHRS